MRLDPATLEELATFYARRLPGGVSGIARACGLAAPQGDGVEAWRALLTSAESVDRTGAVAKAVAIFLPEDENAQVAARTFASPPPRTAWVLGGVVAGGLAGVLIAVLAIGTAVSHPAQAEIAPAPAGHVTKLTPSDLSGHVTKLTPSDLSGDVTKVSDAELGIEETAARRTGVADLGPSTRMPRGGCHGPAGQTVGWWYAGTQAPGAAGETITLRRGANVRSAVPSAKTHWKLASPVGCGLEEGDQVTLGEIRAIPGGVWVELKG